MAIIDIHAHYGAWPFPSKGEELERLLRFLDKYGVEKCVLSSSRAIAHDFVRGNAELAEVLGRDPRLFGYVTLNPNYIELCEREMAQYLRGETKFVGAKLHHSYTGVSPDSPETREVLARLRRYDVPVLVHTYSASDVRQVAKLAAEFRQTKFILAHMGARDWREAIRLARVHTNLFLDPCCSVPDADKISEAVRALPHRVVFGSDMTLLHPAYTLGMVMDADLSDAEREAVLYRNALRLFRFPK
ncbi:MAG TPA: metal-dependent hydrolase [Armatimonadetes bacterium]|nr:metal-dependent hydrolase [Armatimonadota bacterium]